jgi:hypothetical protein
MTLGMASAAMADQILIYTGGGEGTSGAGSTYHEGIGQGVADFLEPVADKFGYDIVLVPSNGAVDNANKVASTTNTIAFGIGQGGLEYDAVNSGGASILRKDLPGECAMAFTAEPRINSWGDVVENARRVTWVVPENSGSEAFIKKLYAEDSNFSGTPKFKYVKGSDSIVATVSNPENRGTVGFFYAYPNPTKGLVNMASKEDMNIFGVLSPEIAKSDTAFYLNRQAPYELAWMGFGKTKTTRAMCSKALLFVNDISNIEDPWAAADAEEIVAYVKNAQASAFTPKNGPLAKVMGQIESMSEELGVNDMVADLEAQISNAKN